MSLMNPQVKLRRITNIQLKWTLKKTFCNAVENEIIFIPINLVPFVLPVMT